MTVTDKYSQIYNNQHKLMVLLIIYSVQYEVPVPRDLEFLTNMYRLIPRNFKIFISKPKLSFLNENHKNDNYGEFSDFYKLII